MRQGSAPGGSSKPPPSPGEPEFGSAPVVKNPSASAGNTRHKGSIPGSGRSYGGGHGNPLQDSACRVPWTEEPGGLQSMESQRVGHDLATEQQQRKNSKLKVGVTEII